QLRDVDVMRAAGLARGGAMDNAVIVDGDRILNEGALRDEREFALHKALDLIGDLYLVGAPVAAHITAFKPGHDLNTALARRLAAECAPATGRLRKTAARRRAIA
ncbi:MAG: UDP-3-O-acyl-N-acetylglucosamine deacetylase, partial [Pseudomonadota bacterium]